MSQGTLADPGILLGMVTSTTPDFAASAVAGATAATGGAGTTRARALVCALICALIWALACTWLMLDVVATQRSLGQLSSPGVSDWLPFVVVAGGGLLLPALLGGGPRGCLRVAVIATAALALAALAPVVLPGARLGGASLRLLLQTFGLGLVLGAPTMAPDCLARDGRFGARGWIAAVLLVAASAAVAAAMTFSELLARMGLAAAGIGSLLVAVLATFTLAGGAGQRARPRENRVREQLAVMGSWCASACLLWLAAPRALWHGGSPQGIAYCALFAAVACMLAMRARGTAMGAALAGLVLAGLQPPPGGPLGNGDLLVRASGGAAVVYRRATQELQLIDSGAVVATAGPDRTEAELAATLLEALLAPGDRVLVLGCGARLPSLLQRTGHETEIVQARPAAGTLCHLLQADGPVTARETSDCAETVRVRELGLRPALRRLPGACRQAIVLAEPLGAASWPQVTLETQLELARVVGPGLVVQVFSLDRAPAGMLRALFAAAGLAHGWNAVFATGESAVLLSAHAAPSWPPPAAFAAWSDDARWTAHGAHLGDLADLQRACLGTLRALSAGLCRDDAPCPAPGASGRKAVLAVLHEHLEPTPDVAVPREGSVLLHWTAMQAGMRAAAATLRTLGTDAKAHAEASAIAAKFLHAGAPAAMLQAALGLPDSDGIALRDPAAASLCAHALDPTFLAEAPEVFADLPRPREQRGDEKRGELEDLAMLPGPVRLRDWCTGDSPRAVALRARFGSRCARALVELLAQEPLPAPMNQALRELADPFVLAAAGGALAQRSAVRELLSLWRGDLPMPQALGLLLRGTVAEQRALLEALPGRRLCDVDEALAHFLVAPEPELRRVAATALRQLVGDLVPYDPDWPGSALNEAADRLRAMHNRNP